MPRSMKAAKAANALGRAAAGKHFRDLRPDREDAPVDLTLTLRLRELLADYKDLRQAPPGGQQRRGQKFNALLAELLQAWGLTARHSVRGVDGLDETDVFFTAEQTNYILEAKWEAEPINAEPLIKLADRLNNRPPGTRGIVLSVSGYTQPALEWVKRRQDILLLDITHIEALLCGMLGPVDLLDLLYAETAAAGNRLVPLADILVPSHEDPGPAPQLRPVGEVQLPWPVVESTANGVTAVEAFTGVWSPPQTPSAFTASRGNRLLITTAAGVIDFHTTTGRSTWALALPGTEDRAVRGEDGLLTVLCRGALVRWHPKTRTIELLAGGFGGYATLEAGRDGTLWVFNQVGALHGGSIILTRIGERPGDEQRHDVPFPGAERAVWLAPGRFFLTANGHSIPLDLTKDPAATKDDWVDSTLPNPKAAVAPDEHTVLYAGTCGSLNGSLHCRDLRQDAVPAELLTVAANRITDLALTNTGSAGTSGWMLADVSGNTQNPTPVLVRWDISAAPSTSG
ncbi:restriction endonuclease [Streptomyces kaniharaensis]|nr:restriction endonuclease [Streptomyces kaniharaensis]